MFLKDTAVYLADIQKYKNIDFEKDKQNIYNLFNIDIETYLNPN